MTDFVVFCFVSIVVVVLLLSAVGLFVLTFADPGRDTSQIVGILADIMTTLIGALVGFIAGKGSGRAEVHDEQLAEAHRMQLEHTVDRRQQATDADAVAQRAHEERMK